MPHILLVLPTVLLAAPFFGTLRSMNCKLSLLYFLLVLTSLSGWAQADIYKCPGSGETITLSNVEKGGKCKKMVLPAEPKRTAAQSSGKETKPVNKPKSAYDSAAAERKRVLQEEIDLERSRLSTVQGRIQELNAVPNKTPDQVKDLVALQQKESLHRSNIQLLQKELNR